MNILVIDQCSKAKKYPDDSEVVTADDIEKQSVDELREESETAVRPARNLYSGRQQEYISKAINKLRTKVGDDVDRYFISAGFGLVAENEPLPSYNVTFNDHSPAELEQRATALDIERDILAVVRGEYDLVFFALGDNYYRTFDLSTVLGAVSADTQCVCFNRESETAEFDNAVSLPARTEQAKTLETIVVALKGKYLKNFAAHREAGKEPSTLQDVKEYCQNPLTEQSKLGENNT